MTVSTNELGSVFAFYSDRTPYTMDSIIEDIKDAVKDELLSAAYPIGSIYCSVNSTNPATLFGGTWKAIGGRFLVGAGSNGASENESLSLDAGDTGGEKEVLLTSDESGVGRHFHRLDDEWPTVQHRHGIADVKWLLGTDSSKTINLVNCAAGSDHVNVLASPGGAVVRCASHDNKACTWEANPPVSFNIADRWKDADQPHNNLPPYLSVYMWKRTA